MFQNFCQKCRPFLGDGSVFAEPLFIISLTVCGAFVFGPRFVLQRIGVSGFAIISLRKRELVALIYFILSSEINPYQKQIKVLTVTSENIFALVS